MDLLDKKLPSSCECERERNGGGRGAAVSTSGNGIIILWKSSESHILLSVRIGGQFLRLLLYSVVGGGEGGDGEKEEFIPSYVPLQVQLCCPHNEPADT